MQQGIFFQSIIKKSMFDFIEIYIHKILNLVVIKKHKFYLFYQLKTFNKTQTRSRLAFLQNKRIKKRIVVCWYLSNVSYKILNFTQKSCIEVMTIVSKPYINSLHFLSFIPLNVVFSLCTKSIDLCSSFFINESDL